MLKMKFIIRQIGALLKQYLKDGNFRRNNRYARYYETNQVNSKYIMYETRDGKSITCNPYAIFKVLLKHEEFQDYTHIWSINNLKANKHLIEEYKSYKNVIFIERESREYLKYLSKSKYLINNSSFPNYFQAKPDQVYINTWHGTPLKYMGRDIPGAPTQLKNILRNFLHTKYLISPNPHTTNMFLKAYQLENLYDGIIIEEGYPRNDLTLNVDKAYFREKLLNMGIKLNKKIILYAPTWKGNNVHKPKNDIKIIIKDIQELQRSIGEEYIVLIKVHPFLYKYIKKVEEVKGICIPDYVDTNELLGIVDILITDYSSIFFDFLITDKPILFYMKERDKYEEERGVYLNDGQLPGPILTDIEGLSESINYINRVEQEYKVQYLKIKQQFCAKDDGKVTERIIDTIFKQNKSMTNIQANEVRSKHRLLIYGGGFFNNGITVSLINLLDNIDYDKYDVSILTAETIDKVKLKNITKINPKARIIFRTGTFNIRLLERIREKIILNEGIYSDLNKKIYPKKAYQRELRRIVGNSKFDTIIDYSGYSMFWDNIILEADANKKIIYLHNNMMQEFYKKANGKYVHKINLTGIFSIYEQFDYLVSVTKSCKETNMKELEKFVDIDRHYYINNPIDFNKIISLANEDNEIILEGESFIKLGDNHSDIRRKIDLLKAPNKNHINFINIGRLSEEKGQEKLIYAFAKIIQQYDNARLYIMGEGVLKNKLNKLIGELGLQEYVKLIGQLDNPYQYLKKCNCFVLSSNHEGQGLVLLEALVLDICTISTDIPGPRSVLEDGYGELVDNTIEALVEGMERFILGEFNHLRFDYKIYNEEAMKSFYKILE